MIAVKQLISITISNLAVLDTEITMDIMSGSYQIDWKSVMCLCKGDQGRGTVKCAVQ